MRRAQRVIYLALGDGVCAEDKALTVACIITPIYPVGEALEETSYVYALAAFFTLLGSILLLRDSLTGDALGMLADVTETLKRMSEDGDLVGDVVATYVVVGNGVRLGPTAQAVE